MHPPSLLLPVAILLLPKPTHREICYTGRGKIGIVAMYTAHPLGVQTRVPSQLLHVHPVPVHSRVPHLRRGLSTEVRGENEEPSQLQQQQQQQDNSSSRKTMTRQGANRIVHHERPRFFLLPVHGGKNTTTKKKTHIKRPTRQKTEHHTMVVVPRIRYLQTFKHV